MSNHLDLLTGLHTALVDSRNGYEEALEDAEGKGMTPLFRSMIVMRRTDADELATVLVAAGEKVDESGSFMSTVHRTVISIRSLFGGLDESVLPGLIDGEKRILKRYDEALTATPAAQPERALLETQRTRVAGKIADMQAMEKKAA